MHVSGEHKTSNYINNVHPFGKVPAINDNGFKLIESIAILRYLARKYDVPDHWYPKDIEKQARVDEFLEWQHLFQRVPLSLYFITMVNFIMFLPKETLKLYYHCYYLSYAKIKSLFFIFLVCQTIDVWKKTR